MCNIGNEYVDFHLIISGVDSYPISEKFRKSNEKMVVRLVYIYTGE